MPQKIVKKAETLVINGDQAVALAAAQSNVDVVAAYPITPQTIIVEKFSEYVANGDVQTEFVCTESEHSAISAALSASMSGARTFTASASAGLALMHEILFVTAGTRAPVVMAVANRALSSPLNIHCDHSDTMAERDSGWIQIYTKNSQEAYDSIIQAFKIAEDITVSLPVIVGLDGFTLSHTLERVDVLSDEQVKKFVGERVLPKVMTPEGKTAEFKLDPDHPLTMGSNVLPNYYFEFKYQQENAMKNAVDKIKEIYEKYSMYLDENGLENSDPYCDEKVLPRKSGVEINDGLVETYELHDADIAVVGVFGSITGTLKEVVDEFRGEDKKVGILRLRTFRPFPVKRVKELLKDRKVIAVMDRSMTPGGAGSPVFTDVRNALFDLNPDERPIVINYIFGLGGRDTKLEDVRKIFDDLQHIVGRLANESRATIVFDEPKPKYLGLKE